MTVTVRPWDMYRAEMTDTIRGHRKSRAKRPCIYCSKPTTSVYRVCCDHTDLLDLDPGAPAALDEARVPPPRAELAAELAPPSLASSSATNNHASPDLANGEPQAGAAVALDNSETT